MLLSVVLGTLLLGLSEGGSWGWTSPAVLGLFAVSAIAAVCWVALELHVDEPLIDIRVLAERPVLLTNATALISGFAMFGSFVLVPRFAEAPGGLPADLAAKVDYGFDASATTIGLYLLPGSLLMLFAGPAAGLLGRRVGSKWPLAIGMGLVGDLGRDPRCAPRCTLAGRRGDGGAQPRRRLLVRRDGSADHGGRRADGTGIATGINTVMRTVGAVVGAQVGAAILTADTLTRDGRSDRGRLRQRVRARRDRGVRRGGARRVRDARPPASARGAGDRARMSEHRSDARDVAEAVEGVLAALTRQRRPSGDPEPGTLSTFQSLVLSALVDRGPVRLGSLADALGTTDATASRNVDVLERQGLVERCPDPEDARGVIVAATVDGVAEVRRRRRQLERLAKRALEGLSPAEARRVTDALVELRSLLDRR